MIAGLASGQIPVTDSLQQHLDNCLTCRACEQICPAKVEVGSILDQGRALILAQQSPTFFRKLFNKVLDLITAYPKPVSRLAKLVRQKWIRQTARSVGLDPWIRALSASQPMMPVRSDNPTEEDLHKSVQLFTGCLGEAMQSHTLNAAILLLNHLGFRVQIPNAQICCGALHQHRGEITRARTFARKNLAVFSEPEIPVIYCATGCGATLSEYQSESSKNFSKQLYEINEFIAQSEVASLSFRPLHKKVLIHDPCSARYPLQCAHFSHQLLSRIEGLHIYTLANDQHCCGAAGTHMLSHAKTAQTLAAPIVEQAVRLQVDYVVSSNVGCALHLGANLPDSIHVCHPVELLAMQLHDKTKLSVE